MKNGKYRLRFQLSDCAHAIAKAALELAPFEQEGQALEAISKSFAMSNNAKSWFGLDASGSNRLRLELTTEQYLLVRDALKRAEPLTRSDAETLVLMCLQFLSFSYDQRTARHRQKKKIKPLARPKHVRRSRARSR